MKDQAQTEEAPRIEINSQTNNESKNTGQKRCLRILHVDDDPCILDVSKQILSMENNFEVDIATSVDEALKKMETQTYDAVVSDYEMPLRNGLDFLKELRGKQNDVPFILFTGKGREEVVVIALNLCADSYINKHGAPETVYCELAHAINKTVERKKSRERLVASESKYRVLVEKSLQGILVTKAAPLRLVFANEAMGKFLGYSAEELTSLSPEGIMGLVYHEDRAVFFKRMENRFRGEPAESCLEFRAVRKDGSIIWLSALANRVDYDGQPAVLGMFLDVTESKKAGEILRDSEQRYRELANSLPDIVFETDINGQLVFANERATEISGYSQKELEKGLNVLQFLVPEDRERATKTIQRLLAGGKYAPAEYIFIRKDGTTFPALITATPCISKGKVTGLRGLVLDITERKKAETVLQASEEQLGTIFEGTSDGIIVADSKTKSFVFANPGMCEITGYSIEELLKMDMSDIHPEKDLPSVTEQFTQQVQGKISLATNVPVLRKDGKIVYCDVTARPAKFGEQEYLVGFFRDITERKEAEEVLRESEENLRSLVDSMDDLVFVLGFDGVFKNYHQPSHKKELYAAPEEFIGKHFRDVLPPQVAELCQAAMKRIEDSGESQEFDYYIGVKGGTSWYNARLSPTKNQPGRKTLVTVVVRNITERKQAEEALKRSNAALVEAQNIAHLGSWQWNIETNQEFWSDELYRIYGFEKQSFQPTPDTFFKALHPDDYLNVVNAAKRAFREKRRYDIECRIKRSNGETRYLHCQGEMQRNSQGKPVRMVGTDLDTTERRKAEQEVSASLKRYQSFIEVTGELGWTTNAAGEVVEDIPSFRNFTGQTYDEVKGWGWTKAVHPEDLEQATQAWQAAVAAKTKYEVEYRLRRRDGVYRNFMARGAPILEEDGQIREWVGTCIDITDRKEAEEALNRAMDEMVRVNEKLGVVGNLTRHDVRNKLCAVTSNAFMIKKKHADQPDIMDGLGKMEQAVKDVVKIFDFAKAYEELGVEELKYVDVEKTLDEAVALFSGSLSLKVNNDCHGLTLLADSFLRQLLYNLIDNSLKHGEKVTKIRVHYARVDQDKLDVVYEDDGVGIPVVNKPNLFREGFTTGGSGYGLYLIKKMIEVYGWGIQENGEPDKGARFTITIPRLNQKGKENFKIA